MIHRFDAPFTHGWHHYHQNSARIRSPKQLQATTSRGTIGYPVILSEGTMATFDYAVDRALGVDDAWRRIEHHHRTQFRHQ